jgi:pimeloyl-ACP methyl ester carboxylesterase/lysophospholipase L1-like esterase
MNLTFKTLLSIWLLSCFFSIVSAQTNTEWNGYRMQTFPFDGVDARIVFPHEVNARRHWIWRARFWGHEPQTDLALLEKGFHLVWIDVADLYGNPQAVTRWNKFYDFLRKEHRLHPKVALEGMSRGGLIIYNWAAENTDKVACIYADAPVCDINSWPGGKGRYRGSETDWKKCLQAYRLTEESARNFKGIPIYTAERVAKAGIPVLHVCGAADDIVPIEENTYPLEERFKKAGGDITVIVKEGIGHHPHSLKDPAPIVRFILSHTAPELLPPSLPAEANRTVHFRQKLQNSRLIFEQKKEGRVAFLGGSITHNPGWRDYVSDYLRERFPDTEFDFINAGIPSMGSTPGAFRFERDVLFRGPVDLLFVEAAVNDATNGRSPTAMIRGMEGIVRHALNANPNMDIIMMHFVDQDKMADYNNGQTPEVIQQHEKVAEHYRITSIDLAKEVNDRILNGEFTWKDDFINLHPSPFGQRLYFETIRWTLDSLWRQPSAPAIAANFLPAKPLDGFSYANGQLVSITEAKKQKKWSFVEKWRPKDKAGTRKGFVDTPVLEATQPGASLTFTFRGTGVGLLVTTGPDAGRLEYSVDGAPFKILEQFTKWSPGLHLPWVFVLEDELTPGKHRLRLRVAEDKDERSAGWACRIHHFCVN